MIDDHAANLGAGRRGGLQLPLPAVPFVNDSSKNNNINNDNDNSWNNNISNDNNNIKNNNIRNDNNNSKSNNIRNNDEDDEMLLLLLPLLLSL